MVKDIGDMFQITANIATTITLIIIWIQTKKMYSDNNLKHDKEEKQKAIELAETYANKLIPKITYIQTLYKLIGIEDKLKKIKLKEMKHFDQAEINELFSLENNELDDILESKKRIKIEYLMQAATYLECEKTRVDALCTYQINSMEEQIAATKDEAVDTSTNIETLKRTLFDVSYYNNEYKSVLTELLNELEYFSMYFNTGLADESVVYQSLHQTYLYTIKLLYLDIAPKNHNGKDKYYTNIIELFNNWEKKQRKKEEEELGKSRSCAEMPQKIKRR